MPIVPGTHVVYTVRPGDSLYTIANELGASLPELIESNALYPPITEPSLIYPGEVLLVRLPGMSEQSAVLYEVNPGDTLYRIAKRFSAGVDMMAALNQLEQPDVLQAGRLLYVPAFVYEVEQGDSLYRISRKFGISLDELLNANKERPGLSLDVVYPGFRLAVPLPSSTNILVTEPLPGSAIAPGDRVKGRARAFEATVLYQLRDASGRVVGAERFVTASEGGPAFGFFDAPLYYDQAPSEPTGTLMVYTRSANDGSIQDLVEISVTFKDLSR
ncbi:LysM peptidoglycan-binding domain-containing protein [Paenibacillus senegalensis]|uniref:LysM peptidoglycan-binding domain-containing protein n=1 Tax=Paenibacillus senegalensis TaxID=1465766 RepID=UPI0002891D3E|nr:LysM peptidoglycan-binding domain-containing protein [Paenibacillus senegalensis]